MARQSSLFDDDPRRDATASPAPKPAAPGSALTALKFTSASLSGQQQRFNRLLERTETLGRKLEAARVLADAHRVVCGTSLRPLENQRDALMRDMVLWLDARLRRPGLTRKQQHMASEILRHLASSFALLAQRINPYITITITISDTKNGGRFDEASFEVESGVPPHRMADFQALAGNAINRVPGVFKVGIKIATKWLQQFGTLEGTRIVQRERPLVQGPGLYRVGDKQLRSACQLG